MTYKFTTPALRYLMQIGLVALVCGCATVFAQRRDHLTDAETDVIRFNQELDKRIEAFIKAADRRFAIINGTAQPSLKQPKKKDPLEEEPDWGESPKGSHAELLDDVAGILDEAITNIDDVNQRDPKNPLISRSLKKLTAAANGYLTQLSALKNKTTNADELAAIDHVAEDAEQIVEAGNKLPAAATTDEDKKKKKP